MTKDEAINIALLSVMGGNGAYHKFKAGSDFFKDLAPYLTFISFVIFVIINRRHIKDFFIRARKQKGHKS